MKIWRRLDWHLTVLPASRARERVGRGVEMRRGMMPMTRRRSTRVKAREMPKAGCRLTEGEWRVIWAGGVGGGGGGVGVGGGGGGGGGGCGGGRGEAVVCVSVFGGRALGQEGVSRLRLDEGEDAGGYPAGGGVFEDDGGVYAEALGGSG